VKNNGTTGSRGSTRDQIIALLDKPEVAGCKFRLIVMPNDVSDGGGISGRDHFYFQATGEEFRPAFDAIGYGTNASRAATRGL